MPNSVSPPFPAYQSNQVTRSSFATSIGGSIKEQTVVWLVGFLIGILTHFSSKITESIRVAINSADLGSQNYEQLAMDLSEFIFQAELIEEFINKGWTTKKSLEPLILSTMPRWANSGGGNTSTYHGLIVIGARTAQIPCKTSWPALSSSTNKYMLWTMNLRKLSLLRIRKRLIRQ